MNMKNVLLIFLMIAIASCGNNNSTPTEQNAKPTATVNNEDVSATAMFKSTDCGTCHKRTENFVGPSFTEIATRYANAADTTIAQLAATIIHGSSGKWKGSLSAMTAHPSLSQTEATDMVKYILQVKQ